MVGSRPLAKIVFAPGVAHTLPDYMAAKIRQPRAFGNAVEDAAIQLSAAQVDALVTALLAQTERAETLPATLRHGGTDACRTISPRERPDSLMDDMQLLQLPRHQRAWRRYGARTLPGRAAPCTAWLVTSLKNPNTLRPALIRRMPKFNVTDAEANTLADYIMTVYQTPAFDADSIDAKSFTPEDREHGRQLFYSRYACQSCHIVDPKNDKGYIGPTLTQVGARLTPAWIFHWLKNPQALRPGTIEPNQHLSDEDARALTAFLAAQKGVKK